MSDKTLARLLFWLATSLIVTSIVFCVIGDMGRAFYCLSIGLFLIWGLKE